MIGRRNVGGGSLPPDVHKLPILLRETYWSSGVFILQQQNDLILPLTRAKNRVPSVPGNSPVPSWGKEDHWPLHVGHCQCLEVYIILQYKSISLAHYYAPPEFCQLYTAIIILRALSYNLIISTEDWTNLSIPLNTNTGVHQELWPLVCGHSSDHDGNKHTFSYTLHKM